MRESAGVPSAVAICRPIANMTLTLSVIVHSIVATDGRQRVERLDQFELLELLFFFERQRTDEIAIGKMSDCFAGLREGSGHLGACVYPENREV